MNDYDYMREALNLANSSYQNGEVPVGAVVVYKGEIIGRGRNMRKETSDITSHAEIEAIREASKYLSSYILEGCTIYTTLEPCPMCSYAIIDSHMDRLVYGATDEKRGAISKLDIFNKHLGTKVIICGNIMSEEASNLLTKFFKEKR